MQALTVLRTILSLSRSLSRTMASTASSQGLNPFARSKAEEISRSWKGTNATGGKTKYSIFGFFHVISISKPLFVSRNYIGGQFVESQTTEWLDVLDPVSRFVSQGYPD